VKRFDPSVGSSLVTFGIAAAVAVLLSVIAVTRDDGNTVQAASSGGAGSGAGQVDTAAGAGGGGSAGAGGGGVSGGGATGAQSAAAGGAALKTVAGAQCAPGKNGGATDTGVSATTIKLAATIVADGPGASFLGPVRTGMVAVVNRVNNAGGVCGRKLDVTLRNDSWQADLGQTYIKNFVEADKVFALAVVPSSEGLESSDDYIREKGVPVVGTDGMLIKQYKNPWIWPVATSTISTMHVMADDAFKAGAKNFAIVFDAKYHFGVEGAYAFDQAVKRRTGADIPGFNPQNSCQGRYCGIPPSQSSYAGQVQSFNNACQSGTACDFIGYLLEPDTALNWFKEGPYRPTNKTGPHANFNDGTIGGAQPLFTRPFAENCQAACDGMYVYTGYNPPIEDLANIPGVAQYVNDVRSQSASVDVTNQFVEGGYQGMTLLVKALEKVGPVLTRGNLKAALDSMSLDTGLSSPLKWSAGNHFANTSAQAFEIQYKQSFSGWRRVTGFNADPWVGQDIPPGQ
jgi:ABC-type branched-subunit amino acid transport system substrate-binding protein